MRTLQRNKQKMYYALQTGIVPVYETDDGGNVLYDGYEDSDGNFIPYLDADGNMVPRTTGEYEPEYAAPVEFYSSISMGGGDVTMEPFGVDPSNYDAELLMQKGEFPLTETSLLWFQTEPKYKDDEQTKLDGKSADFKVVRIVESQNFTAVILQKVTK